MKTKQELVDYLTGIVEGNYPIDAQVEAAAALLANENAEAKDIVAEAPTETETHSTTKKSTKK
jgi:cytochrome c556